ncbi:MAG: phospho-N-acetylmuramoyl-pentapeptide-transferase [Patescibacteria group bacterium]|nr:phospho-N-acetylmuramoyl-pentapeptide-transferase [Patescibacteria group bacterium]
MQHIQDINLVTDAAKVLIMTAIAFVTAILLTPVLTHFLYKYKLGKNIRSSGAPVYTKLHQKKAGTPTMGGILIWASVLILIILFLILGKLFPNYFGWMNFMSRSETWLPLFALIITALIGLLDDLMNVFKVGPKGGGLRMRAKIVLYTLVAAIGAWWFYYKLGWDSLHVPGIGDFSISWWYFPLFVLVIVATSFSVNESDGLDGLAGGILLTCFSAYAVIAFMQDKVDLATFCGAVVGALLAFLWFNIYPARFFMGDTGAFGLGTTLGVIAMLTNSVLVLPIIALPLVLESGSVIIQMISKKLFKHKVFISTPIHHHFEALGWPETKVTMRFWIIAIISAGLGLIIGLIGRG